MRVCCEGPIDQFKGRRCLTPLRFEQRQGMQRLKG